MKRRKWTPGQKALVVLEGLGERPVGERCNEHGLSQAKYDQCTTGSRATLGVCSRRSARTSAGSWVSVAGLDRHTKTVVGRHAGFQARALPGAEFLLPIFFVCRLPDGFNAECYNFEMHFVDTR